MLETVRSSLSWPTLDARERCASEATPSAFRHPCPCGWGALPYVWFSHLRVADPPCEAGGTRGNDAARKTREMAQADPPPRRVADLETKPLAVVREEQGARRMTQDDVTLVTIVPGAIDERG